MRVIDLFADWNPPTISKMTLKEQHANPKPTNSSPKKKIKIETKIPFVPNFRKLICSLGTTSPMSAIVVARR